MHVTQFIFRSLQIKLICIVFSMHCFKSKQKPCHKIGVPIKHMIDHVIATASLKKVSRIAERVYLGDATDA